MKSIFLSNKLLLIAVFIAGCILRLIWIEDMEWKDDEKVMYELAHNVASAGQFPELGMMSGGGIVNPGLSVGVFSFIALFTDNPISMARAVQLANILAILFFLLFIYMKVPVNEKEIWFWGMALASISPLAVLFSRKIWAQDLLPFFCFFLILGNANRQKKWGAFLWGFAGALIGQIHMSGFFLAAGMIIFTLLHDRCNRQRFHWFFFIAGSIAGSISMLPWLKHILQSEQHSSLMLNHILELKFFWYWLLDAHGLNIIYSLGDNFWEYVEGPVINGNSFYLIAALHLFLIIVGLITLWWLIKYCLQLYAEVRARNFVRYHLENISMLRFYLYGILIGLGILLTCSGTEIFAHYLICTFPFSYIFLLKIHFQQKKLLAGIIIAQLLITVSFLFYIHQHNGALRGDYKRTYHSQIEYNLTN